MFSPMRALDLELTFCANFAKRVDRSYGMLFYNSCNPLSHDSNHGVIRSFENAQESISDIVEFYRQKKLAPRLYQGFLPDEKEILFPILKANAFQIREWPNDWLYLQEIADLVDSELSFRQVKELDPQIEEIIHCDEYSPWTVGVIQSQLAQENFHLLVGYQKDLPVAMGSVRLMDGYSRIDDVATLHSQRRKGYGSALINFLVNYHRNLSDNHLYLYSVSPQATVMYRKNGFVDFPVPVVSWGAWQETAR